MVATTGQEYSDALKKLIADYDAYIAELAPFTYQDGRHMHALRQRKDGLLSLKPGEVFVEEIAPFTQQDWQRIKDYENTHREKHPD